MAIFSTSLRKGSMMTNNAFVKALRGPEDTPDNINPLSYLLTAILSLSDLETSIAARDEDPSAFEEAIDELRHLHRDLKAALAAHDAGQPNPDAMRCAICGWTVDTSQPPAKPLPPPRRKPEVVVSAEALAAALNLEKLAF